MSSKVVKPGSRTEYPAGVLRRQDLEPLVAEAVEDLRRILRSRGTLEEPGSWESLGAAGLHAIRRIMGQEWTGRLRAGDRDVSCRYIIADEDDSMAEASRIAARLNHLALVLYDLQGIQYIGDRLQRLHGKMLESTAAELHVVWALREAGAPTELRAESEGGYDADIRLDDGVEAAAEIKCKVEDGPLTENAIVKPLKRARDQLPNDRPTMVWLRVPTTWTTTSGVLDTVRVATEQIFRNTERISAIVYHWDAWVETNDAHAYRLAFDARLNPNASFAPASLGRVFERMVRRRAVLSPFLLSEVESYLAMINGGA